MVCWMPNDHMDILRSESADSISQFVRNKTELDLRDPLHVEAAPKSFNLLTGQEDREPSWYTKLKPKALASAPPTPKIHSGLSMTSRMSYFSDRILNPESILD